MDFSLLNDVAGKSIQLYALMTPPAVLSAFISGTRHYDAPQKARIALKTSTAMFLIGVLLYLFGPYIFELFGFTLDAFRIGAGVLLFLTAVGLMRDSDPHDHQCDGEDISVVPLAIPLGMGPASIGAVMVMGASAQSGYELALGVSALFLAALGMYVLLRMSDVVARVLRRTGIAVLSKLTGLLLAAIAAQVIFTGIQAFMK